MYAALTPILCVNVRGVRGVRGLEKGGGCYTCAIITI